MIQATILQDVCGIDLQQHDDEIIVKDEVLECRTLKPWDREKPFFHPAVVGRENEDGSANLSIQTVSQPVYGTLGEFFDTGFFSSTATKIRAKLNSPDAMLRAMGKDYEDVNVENIAALINNATIQWALEQPPESVRRRYLARGLPWVAGPDRSHNNGPGWIWSGLSFDRRTDAVEVRLHTMHTSVDHQIHFADGKLYMKLLSPARVLDWMYTDSLRQASVKRTFASSILGANSNEPHSPVRSPERTLAPSFLAQRG
jgi:hypothetical protein